LQEIDVDLFLLDIVCNPGLEGFIGSRNRLFFFLPDGKANARIG